MKNLLFALLVFPVLVAGCSSRLPVIPSPLSLQAADRPLKSPGSEEDNEGKKADARTPLVPFYAKKTVGETLDTKPAADEKSTIVLNFDQLTLPTFIQLVFGEILKKNVQVEDGVRKRKDLVTLRSGGPQTHAQVEKTAVMLLKSYGLAVVDVGGLVRVLPDNSTLGYVPEIRRGNALPETPLPLRPQFHLIELQAVRNPDVAGWLKTMFGDRVKVQEDPSRNAVLISGTPDNVAAAIEAIRVLDQPLMQGRRSLRVTPRLWSVDDMTRRLFDVLSAEGYAVNPLSQAPGSGIRYPVTLLPVSAINSILVFASSEDVLKHVEEWVRVLDQPAERGIGQNYFTYQVKHKDASELAATIGDLLNQSGTAKTGSATSPAPAPAAAVATGAVKSTHGVVVDKASNMLIFQGSPEIYTQMRSLMQTLDRPSRAAVIEVTVAEVSLTDKFQFGVEWAFQNLASDGSGSSVSTLGGLGIGTAGLTYSLFDSGNRLKAVVNALASDNQATILSSPRVMARNGESAMIQVGQEVPIITSQQTTLNAASPTETGVLQTVQYRQTGVILRVKPVIHSSDQINLDVTQEVSAAQSTNTGVNNSPTFGTRKLETKLTLKNGSTVLLGGLISSTSDKGNAGIPFLKDIPGIGQLFRNDTNGGTRTELIVLITPYIINDDYDAQSITSAFRGALGSWAAEVIPVSKNEVRQVGSAVDKKGDISFQNPVPAGSPTGSMNPVSGKYPDENRKSQVSDSLPPAAVEIKKDPAPLLE